MNERSVNICTGLIVGGVAIVAMVLAKPSTPERHAPVAALSAAPVAPPSVAPAPPPPPCIHETCAERPHFLKCMEVGGVGATGRCDLYEILYEQHCTCDTWASAPVDGGP